MAITTNTISRLYNFIAGKKASNIQVNEELDQLVSSINSTVSDLTNIEADKATNTSLSNLAGAGRTTETVKKNADDLETHKTSTDHDHRYYTETEIDGKITTINNTHNTLQEEVTTHRSGTDHDSRYYTKDILNSGQLDNRYYTQTQLNSGQMNNLYYTKDDLLPFLRGGDTIIREEVFTIVNPDNADGTFTYTKNGSTVIGSLTQEGYQVFELTDGFYDVGMNRVELTINDTLRRSVASGGLQEIDETHVALTSIEGTGAEITIKYYERIGLAAEYNIKMGTVKPPLNNGKNMWFKIIG